VALFNVYMEGVRWLHECSDTHGVNLEAAPHASAIAIGKDCTRNFSAGSLNSLTFKATRICDTLPRPEGPQRFDSRGRGPDLGFLAWFLNLRLRNGDQSARQLFHALKGRWLRRVFSPEPWVRLSLFPSLFTAPPMWLAHGVAGIGVRFAPMRLA